MIRQDNSKFLLYIEPKNKKSEPIIDEWTDLLNLALSHAKSGTANYSSNNEPERFHEGSAYKGIHCCSCNEHGGNKDYLLENGMITNYLCTHYIQCHRDEIPERDWKMLNELKQFYNKKENLTHLKTFENFKNNI